MRNVNCPRMGQMPQSSVVSASFEALAESATDAIVIVDEASTILYANAAVERIFGHAPDGLIGGPLAALIPERMREAHTRGFARYVRTGERRIPWTGVSLPGLRADGTEVPLEISFGDFVDEEGKRRFSGFMRDVSERERQRREVERLFQAERQAREDERALRAEAEAAVRSRDEVLSIVSHDLRNPVSTIAMSAALLDDAAITLAPDQRQRQVGVIRRSAQRMNRLIQDLLDVAGIEGGRLRMNCSCEPAGAMAAEACESFRPILERRSRTFVSDIAGDLPVLHADRDRILQVLSNLLGNAAKFTPEGGTIVLSAKRAADGGCRYSVSDTGPGMDAEQLAHVFDRFWQAKKTAHLGSGLGLAIAKGIVEAHRGRISVESVPGRGTKFFVDLPRSSECG